MAKIAYSPQCDRVYLVGGARDQKSRQTVANMKMFYFGDQGMQQQELAPMVSSRASFGCLFNPVGNGQIFVAGGYINGKLSNKCEVYNV